jgi:hypothetical protein
MVHGMDMLVAMLSLYATIRLRGMVQSNFLLQQLLNQMERLSRYTGTTYVTP